MCACLTFFLGGNSVDPQPLTIPPKLVDQASSSAEVDMVAVTFIPNGEEREASLLHPRMLGSVSSAMDDPVIDASYLVKHLPPRALQLFEMLQMVSGFQEVGDNMILALPSSHSICTHDTAGMTWSSCWVGLVYFSQRVVEIVRNSRTDMEFWKKDATSQEEVCRPCCMLFCWLWCMVLSFPPCALFGVHGAI